jgi:hypothetical protein
MISTLTILELTVPTLTVLELMVSTHLVSTLTIGVLAVSTRTMLQRNTGPAGEAQSRHLAHVSLR